VSGILGNYAASNRPIEGRLSVNGNDSAQWYKIKKMFLNQEWFFLELTKFRICLKILLISGDTIQDTNRFKSKIVQEDVLESRTVLS